MNNCFSIYHTSWITRGPKSNFVCDNIPTKANLFLIGCSEVNSTWLITSELANQRARKVLFTCVVYTNPYSCGVFLDFSKAFDTVNHTILLKKMGQFGVRSVPLQFFERYLTMNRQQYVQMGNTVLSEQTMTCGIPQGFPRSIIISNLHERFTELFQCFNI